MLKHYMAMHRMQLIDSPYAQTLYMAMHRMQLMFKTLWAHGYAPNAAHDHVLFSFTITFPGLDRQCDIL